MMTLRRNKQKMWYSLQGGLVPIYEYYTDDEGNKHPIETGEYKTEYLQPVIFYGNISMSGGEARNVEFGLDLTAYEAVLIVGKGELPLTETSRIWFENEPKYNADGTVDEFSADYRIVKIGPSLNFDKYVLAKVVK